jgi:hypothetical protein
LGEAWEDCQAGFGRKAGGDGASEEEIAVEVLVMVAA